MGGLGLASHHTSADDECSLHKHRFTHQETHGRTAECAVINKRDMCFLSSEMVQKDIDSFRDVQQF